MRPLLQTYRVIAVVNWFLPWIVAKLLMRSLASRVKEFKVENVYALSIVQWALFESVTLLGFIIASSQVAIEPMLPFLVAGLSGMLLTFPSQRRILALVEAFRAYQAR